MIHNADLSDAALAGSSCLESLWEAGQRHLVAGHYMTARRLLEQAEMLAWRNADALVLSRIYLPLLEACRLLRQQACEGSTYILTSADSATQRRWTLKFLQEQAGCMLIGAARQSDVVLKLIRDVEYFARRSGRSLETFVLVHQGNHWRLTAPAQPIFAAGLTILWTQNPADSVTNVVTENTAIPLPPPGIYPAGSPFARLAGESILAAGELLAMKWQERHQVIATPWDEIRWLRQARQIDPASEPVMMRLIALSGEIARNR